MLTSPPSSATKVPADGVSHWLAIAATVLVFVVAVHIWSIGSGLFLDDHAHFQHLREADWSFRGAVESSRLGIVGDVMDLWGRREAGLRFFRPVAFWLMKAEYTIVGWSPAGMHVFSLLWHYLCCMLVATVAWRAFGRHLWAGVAGCLMAMHPGHIATVYWVACQTELMTTAFLLLGILAYARHAGWGDHWFTRQGQAEIGSAERNRDRRLFSAGIAIACYGLALGCRENALLFPLVCWAGDRLIGPGRRRIVTWSHLALIAVAGVYFLLRQMMLGGFQMPSKPYIMPVGEPGFIRFMVEKLVYYTIGMFGYTPVVPMGGRAYFASRPLAFYGGFLLTVVIMFGIWAAYRYRRALVWPVAWIGFLIAPVLPVFASSHHLYLPSVGMVLLVTAGLALLGGVVTLPRKEHPVSKPVACGVVLGLHVLILGLLNWVGGFSYTRGTMSEDLLIADVIERAEAPDDGDHLFFINMPILAYYAVPAIEAETGLEGIQGHVLTFSTRLSRMETPSVVDVLDEYRLRVRAPAGEQYFSGVTGQTLLEVMGFEGTPPIGEEIDAGLFTVTPIAGNEEGLTEMVFRFKEKLTTPQYRFYLGSPQFLAYPLDVSRPTADALKVP